MTSTSLTFVKIAFAALIVGTTPALAQQTFKLPVTTITAGMHVIKAEIAATDEARQQGLMFRKKMGQNEGMLFVFPSAASVCMWMKNTFLPLSVAFINDDGKIVNIEDMQPKALESHCAGGQVRYALEMNQGWFKQKNIKPGSRIEGLPRH